MKKTLAMIGSGKLAHIVADALISGLLPEYEFVGVYSRKYEHAQLFAEKINDSIAGTKGVACESMEDLLALKADYIVEAAAPAMIREWAIPALQRGSSLVVLSIGALADADFYEKVKKTASENGRRVHLVSGSIGGFDVLRTISLMEEGKVSFDTEKGPDSLKNTSVYSESLQKEKKMVFEGNAAEAIALFPTKVNVAVAAALATKGPQNIDVSITSTPGYTGDRHQIRFKSEQIDALIDIYSKTSEIAGWSVVHTLRNITSPIVF